MGRNLRKMADLGRKTYTENDINQHAAKVGGKNNLREIIVIDDNVEYHYLVKRPTRSVVQAVAKNSNDVNAAAKIMIGCILEGDLEAIENNGAIYLSIVEKITSLIGGVKSEIKKI